MAKTKFEKVDFIVEDKTFTNKDGDEIEYVDARVVIDGESVKVRLAREDRSLLRVLRRELGTDMTEV